MDKQKFTELAQKRRGLFRFLFAVHNRFPFVNRWQGKPQIGLAWLRGCRVTGGRGNTLIIGDFARLKNCHFHFEGTGNTVSIGPWCSCEEAEFWIEDSGCTISLGAHTALCGDIQLAAMEGTDITVGEGCLFANAVRLRTGDSHSLLKKSTGARINPSKSITVGNHVWVGTGVTILKGVQVADGCVVGAGSLLAKAYSQPNCVLAGVPAREVKQDVDWTPERIPVQEIL